MEYAAPRPGLEAAGDVSFVHRVFGWMFLGLAVTGGVSAFLSATLSDEFLEDTGMPYFLGAIVLELVLVLGLVFLIKRMSSTVALGAFLLYAALNGFTFAFIFHLYTTASVFTAFFVTAGMFGAMAVYGWVTKRDLSGLGSILFMALIGLILASVVNLFLASDVLYWITTYAGVVIFAGLTAYDMQKIKRYDEAGVDEETERKDSIIGALSLYLDFINLFLFLLRIFGARR